jgi:glycerophosphoryl diester phosphodiesterase/HEAT repeat protein
MKTTLMLLLLAAAIPVYAGELLPGGVQLLCHRTANEDLPENTLESLDQAALLGCNVVEIDLRRTLDGQIVLNHDGITERLTDGAGDVETSYYGDLQLRDLGLWMGERFVDMHIALFADALRLARERDIRLVLDMKDKGLGADVLRILEREGMLQRVQFNGEWDDVKKLYPAGTDVGHGTKWVQPGVTAEQVKEFHRQGKAVVANFSANQHEMDLAGMKAAVAAGVDGINVDYPRLGADAVGRPVERRLHELMVQAGAGESENRAAAILELSRYSGFPLQEDFATWLLDADKNVSRSAAVALVRARPRTPAAAFSRAIESGNANVRENAAWALGMLSAPAAYLLPLLDDKDPSVLRTVLLALGRAPGEVSANILLPFLSRDDPATRGAAAIALARHQPQIAIVAVPRQLQKEIVAERALHHDYLKRGEPKFSPPEVAAIMKSFKCQMEMTRAIAMVEGDDATRALAALAFRAGEGLSSYDGIVAGFQLWDRIATDPEVAIEALGSSDHEVADRAEWILVKANPAVLPALRKALGSSNQGVRERAIRIVAWQADTASLPLLQTMPEKDPANAALAAWAMEKISSFQVQ